MSLQNIKTSSRGFTIVELLIVVVVIAILAAITIISYNGITSRANASSAASNAETIQKIAETYNSDCSRYPASVTEFKNGCTTSGGQTITAAAKLPTGITVSNPALGGTGTANLSRVTAATHTVTASNGTNTVEVFGTGSSSTPTGGVIITWDYGTNAVQANSKYSYYGAATSTSTDFFALGN